MRYMKGDWNAICDSCGFLFKASKLRERWDGLMVCSQDWETRHPQDYIKVPTEDTSVPWTRPEQPDVFVEPTYVASTVGTQNNNVPAGTFNTTWDN